MSNPFFKKRNNIKINNILSVLNKRRLKVNYNVNDIKEIVEASRNDITFLHSIKYL